MRNMIIALLLMVVTTGLFAQSAAFHPSYKNEPYIPKTLSAGTSMTGRTAASGYDDTTQAFEVRRFAQVYVGIETLANDSSRTLFSYSPSLDGVTFDAYVLFDSLSTTTPVGKGYYFALPANAMAAHSVRVRAFGNTDLLRYSSSPVTTLTIKIIRKQH